MSPEPERYPALHVIFALLTMIRRGIDRKNIWREFRRQKIALQPRLAFWIALCKEAHLIDDDDSRLRVTRQARAWLNKTSEEQTFHLLESWQNAPSNRKARQFRRKLLWKLKYGERSTPQSGSVDKPLTQKDLKAINGLEALGLCKAGKLTGWGKYLRRSSRRDCPARTRLTEFSARSTPSPFAGPAVPARDRRDCPGIFAS
jgi:hypothetical protein